MALLIISDEKLGHPKEPALTIDCLTESLTVRELIRQRVYQEVQDYNHRVATDSAGPLPKLLVTPTEMETRLNARSPNIAPNRPPTRREIRWEDQFELACRAFQSNGFFVLIGDRQAEELDEEFPVALETEITFVKLVPLVGG